MEGGYCSLREGGHCLIIRGGLQSIFLDFFEGAQSGLREMRLDRLGLRI